MSKKIEFVLTLVITLIISCKNDKKLMNLNPHDVDKHWSYEGETSPEHWAEIEKESDCSGRFQSPIDIEDSSSLKDTLSLKNLEILYTTETELRKVLNNGHSIEFDFDEGDSLRYLNDTYHLKQIHFHEPSEHTINGLRFPIEMHLVHVNTKNDFTVIGILGEEGDETDFNEFFNLFLPIKEGEEKEVHKPVDLTELFRDKQNYYSYKGSLTTPPCTENVNWIIFKESISISKDAILLVKNNMPLNNYRNEQPLNGRLVYRNSIKD